MNLVRNMTLTSVLAILIGGGSVSASEVDIRRDVLETYADIALAKYEDSLQAAKRLDGTIGAFLAEPSERSMTAARDAWRAARFPYQQTEVYRFGNPIVDAWEGRINAWPLDEGLIDYVDLSYGEEAEDNALYSANVIANRHILINGKPVEVATITPDFLANTLHEAGNVEKNVATGYHAVEFLLWGQDLNYTEAGAGNRPPTDFDLENCSNGNCDRRRQYLAAASELMIADLEEIVADWGASGRARMSLLDGDPKQGLMAILTGMGSLSYGELAGERMKLGLLLKDPEEEHDCFSDNTHYSHYYNALGIANVYVGEYRRTNGILVKGRSLSDLVSAAAPEIDQEMRQKLRVTMAAMTAIVERANTIEAYDQMIGELNPEGNAAVDKAINALIDQTTTIERIVSVLDLGTIAIEGSDSLTSPQAVFQ